MSKTMSSPDIMVLPVKEHDVSRRPLLIPANLIRTDSEAVSAAQSLASKFRPGAARRDQSRAVPLDLIDDFSQSGLWAITVPREYGGAEVSHVTLADVIAIIAEADPSLAQLPQNHFNDVDTLRWAGDGWQKRFFFSEVLFGARFGNAYAEAGNKDPSNFQTRLSQSGGRLTLNGTKIYATGALTATWVQVGAVDDLGMNVLVFVRRDTHGLTVVDDWSGFGQRTTGSGTVLLKDIEVEPQNVVQAHRAMSSPTTNGPLSQLIHAAIDLGMGRAIVGETISFVKGQSRAWVDANVDRASDDPLIIVDVGKLELALHSAEAMLNRAAKLVDFASENPTDATVAESSIAVAEAKIATTEFVLLAADKLFELSGTKSTLEKYALDRHWRNARTHTLHDPVRWKYHAVGNYYLNQTNPERHGWI